MLHNKQQNSLGRKIYSWLGALAIAYSSLCLFLYLRQENILYSPKNHLYKSSPLDDDFQLTHYQDFWIDVPGSQSRIHGWWFAAPPVNQPIIAVQNEPVNILTEPKTILYLCGRGGSKTHYNNLARIKGFQQLGFSVLVIDYRGYGLSEGTLPNESRLYADSSAAWDYLTKTKNIAPEQIIIYGESLGGAIAIDLALKQPRTAGLIVQSSFTSMVEQVNQAYPQLRIFPLDQILHQRFESVAKVKSLAVPVLYLHGTSDSIVNYQMSHKLFYASSEPKMLFLIPEAEHLNLYKPGKDSYLKAIARFVTDLD